MKKLILFGLIVTNNLFAQGVEVRARFLREEALNISKSIPSGETPLLHQAKIYYELYKRDRNMTFFIFASNILANMNDINSFIAFSQRWDKFSIFATYFDEFNQFNEVFVDTSPELFADVYTLYKLSSEYSSSEITKLGYPEKLVQTLVERRRSLNESQTRRDIFSQMENWEQKGRVEDVLSKVVYKIPNIENLVKRITIRSWFGCHETVRFNNYFDANERVERIVEVFDSLEGRQNWLCFETELKGKLKGASIRRGMLGMVP